MKLTKICLNTSLFIFLSTFLCAEPLTLSQVLITALETNPTLKSAEASLCEAKSHLKVAQSERNPSFRIESEAGLASTSQKSKSGVSSFGGVGGQSTTVTGTSSGSSRVVSQKVRPRSGKAVLEQPLYKGGRIDAGIDKACFALRAKEYEVKSIRDQLIQEITSAYLNVVVAQTKVELQQKTEQVLHHHLEAARVNLKIGSTTRTDVAQAESRYAGAHAERLQAQSGLKEAQSHFEKLVGYVPPRLHFPDVHFTLPPTAAEAVRKAECANPELAQARYNEEESAAHLREVRGELLPTLSLRGETGQINDQFFQHIRTRNSGVYANLSIPLYSNGGTRNRINAARHDKTQKMYITQERLRDIRARVMTTFENVHVQRAKIEARQKETRAAELALEGLKVEAESGARTLLDVLDGESEVLTARLNHITARADYIKAGYELMKLTGQLS